MSSLTINKADQAFAAERPYLAYPAPAIIAALFWGAVSGEWKGASRRALVYNWTGVGVLLLAIAVISAGNAG